MLLSKFYIAMVIINLAYGWMVLSTQTIMGVAFTAPFSAWSFGGYLAGVMPMATATALFLLGAYFSNKEKQTKALTLATPVNQERYMLVRSGAVASGFLLICILAFASGVLFFGIIFGRWGVGGFILPALLTVLPGFIFFLGFGRLVGSIRPWMLYILIPLVLVAGIAGMPGVLDFFGGGYFNNYPLGLPLGADGEPEFVFSSGFLIVRGVYLILGCFFYGSRSIFAEKFGLDK